MLKSKCTEVVFHFFMFFKPKSYFYKIYSVGSNSKMNPVTFEYNK